MSSWQDTLFDTYKHIMTFQNNGKPEVQSTKTLLYMSATPTPLTVESPNSINNESLKNALGDFYVKVKRNNKVHKIRLGKFCTYSMRQRQRIFYFYSILRHLLYG